MAKMTQEQFEEMKASLHATNTVEGLRETIATLKGELESLHHLEEGLAEVLSLDESEVMESLYETIHIREDELAFYQQQLAEKEVDVADATRFQWDSARKKLQEGRIRECTTMVANHVMDMLGSGWISLSCIDNMAKALALSMDCIYRMHTGDRGGAQCKESL